MLEYCGLLCKDENPWLTKVPLEALSHQVWIRYQFLWFWKLIIFNCGFSTKVTAEKKLSIRIKQWKPRKMKSSSTLLIAERFQWYCCESGIVIIARSIWNYAHSPFKNYFNILVQCKLCVFLLVVWNNSVSTSSNF